MAQFYNPYSKYPDFGQGASDIMYQMRMMQLMKMLMGQNQQQSPDATPQQAPPPMANIPPPQGIGQQITGAAPSTMGQQQFDPQLMMILRMLMQRNAGR